LSREKKYHPAPEPDFKLAERLINELTKAHWSDEPGSKGMHAYGYTPQEQEAIDIVVREAVKQHMEAFSDLAGNVYLILRGVHGAKSTKTDVIVSHLDTIEKGGAHDGRDGIVAGLAVVAGLNKAKVKPKNDLCVMIARSEESDINGQVSIGAKAATGGLPKTALDDLKNRKTGRTLWREMSELGIPVAELDKRLDITPTLFPTKDNAKDLIGFLVEAHIEQGNYCVKQDINVGIVDAIRGNTRFQDVVIEGERAHSGATHMEDRADAVRAYIELSHAAIVWCDKKRKKGQDIVFTPSMINSTNRSISSVADNAIFSFEIRSADEKLLHEFSEFFNRKAAEIVDTNPTDKLKIKQLNPDLTNQNLAAHSAIQKPPPYIFAPNLKPNITAPAVMDTNLISHAQWIAEQEKIASGIITSGAGHDTAQFANTGTPSAMIFIRQPDAISHNPREARSESSFRDACKIISGMVMNPSEQTEKKSKSTRGGFRNFTDYIIKQGAKEYTPGQWRR